MICTIENTIDAVVNMFLQQSRNDKQNPLSYKVRNNKQSCSKEVKSPKRWNANRINEFEQILSDLDIRNATMKSGRCFLTDCTLGEVMSKESLVQGLCTSADFLLQVAIASMYSFGIFTRIVRINQMNLWAFLKRNYLLFFDLLLPFNAGIYGSIDTIQWELNCKTSAHIMPIAKLVRKE